MHGMLVRLAMGVMIGVAVVVVARSVRGRGRRETPAAPKCPNCGERINPGAAVCHSCGSLLER